MCVCVCESGVCACASVCVCVCVRVDIGRCVFLHTVCSDGCGVICWLRVLSDVFVTPPSAAAPETNDQPRQMVTLPSGGTGVGGLELSEW